MLLGKHATVEARPAGRADRRDNECPVEADSFLRQFVHVRRFYFRVVVADGAIRLIVAEDDDKIGLLRRSIGGMERGQQG